MTADSFLDVGQTDEKCASPRRDAGDRVRPPGAAVERTHSLRTMLSRELRFAEAEYRMLALHAGPSDSITLDAKQQVARLSALLRAETARTRDEARERLRVPA